MLRARPPACPLFCSCCCYVHHSIVFLPACLPVCLRPWCRLGKGDKNAADQAAVDMMSPLLHPLQQPTPLVFCLVCAGWARATRMLLTRLLWT